MHDGSIVDRLEATIGIGGSPRQLRDAILRILLEEGFSELKALEKIDRRIGNIRNVIENRRRAADDHGLIAVIELCGSTSSSVAGTSFELGSDDENTKRIKKGRVAHDRILEEMHDLTADEFEAFGAALIKTFGAEKSQKTQSSGDQGIDFFGSIILSDLLKHPKQFFKLTADVRIDFLGQAKHYPKTKIGPSVVREMVGSLELARSRNFSSKTFTALDDLALTSFGPVLAVLITTGPVTSGARQVADSAGVMLKSGEQLATYLCDLGIGLDAEGNFERQRFRNWINQYS